MGREARMIAKLGTEQPDQRVWLGLTRWPVWWVCQGGTHCLQDQPQEAAQLGRTQKNP